MVWPAPTTRAPNSRSCASSLSGESDKSSVWVMTVTSAVAQIAESKTLLDAGAIDESEFAVKREVVLERISFPCDSVWIWTTFPSTSGI